MNSRTVDEFWNEFDRLPRDVQELARRAYAEFERDPFQRSLYFKRVGGRRQTLWSVRIGLRYRAVASRDGDDLLWF